MEKGERTIYLMPKDAQYEITVKEMSEHKIFTATCQSAIMNGKSYPLHNEITFTFKIIDGKIDIVDSKHIGTVDIIFSKEEGDDCDRMIEEFNPGLLDQLNTKLKEMKYL